MMHFKTEDVVEALQLGDFGRGDEVELVLMGELLDGAEFSASDCVVIVERAHRRSWSPWRETPEEYEPTSPGLEVSPVEQDSPATH